MNEKLKTINLRKAITLLPLPKTFSPSTVSVAVGKLKYSFQKHENEWYLLL